MEKFFVICLVEDYIPSVPYLYGFRTAEEAYEEICKYLKRDLKREGNYYIEQYNKSLDELNHSYEQYKNNPKAHFFHSSDYYVQEVFIEER